MTRGRGLSYHKGMNLSRETILAVIAGFAVGLAATWGVWSFVKSKSPSSKEVSPIAQATPLPKDKKNISLVINQPEEAASLTQDQVQVSGKAENAFMIVVSGPLDDQVLKLKSDGAFSTAVKLEEGTNYIAVTAYPKNVVNNQEVSETRTVNYTKEEF